MFVSCRRFDLLSIGIMFVGSLVIVHSAFASPNFQGRTASVTGNCVNQAHHLTKNSAPNPEGRVVFFGDSITEAWPQLMPEFFGSNQYVGRGVSGETTGQMLKRFDRDVVALTPKAIVILAGTNDIAENDGPYDETRTRANLKAMTTRAQSAGIRVILASLLPTRNYPWHDGVDPAPKIIALNAWIRDYASAAGADYLDYFGAMADEQAGLPSSLSEDGVHPGLDGYRLMAPLADAAIKQAICRP